MAAQKKADALKWNEKYANPDSGVRYGQFGRKNGNSVNTAYTNVQ